MNDTTPVISVCIANYNGEAVVSACIDSVLRQEAGCPTEIIVHDDASTDASVALIESRFPEVKLICAPHNSGYCVSNNRMVSASRGKYLLLLNNDAVLRPGALEVLWRYAEADASRDILSITQYDYAGKQVLDRGMLLDVFANPIPNYDEGREDVAMVMGSCLWVSREQWVRLGGFPEWFESLAEDMYLCCYARLLGHKVRVVPGSAYEHWVGHSLGGGKVTEEKGLRTSLVRRRLSERNKTFVIFLFYPLPMLCFLLPMHCLLLLLEGIVLGVVKRDLSITRMVYLHPLQVLLRDWEELSQRRRTIQSSRKVGTRIFFRVFRLFPHKLRLLAKHGVPKLY